MAATALPPFELAPLARFLAQASGAASVEIAGLELLPGGAIQQNWGFAGRFAGGRLAGTQHLVLRTDASTGIPSSLSRVAEYAVQQAAFAAGVTVPEPLFACADAAVIGQPFFVMRRLAGTAQGRRITADPALEPMLPEIAHRLGRELARLQRVRPPRRDLAFLPAIGPVEHIASFRAYLDHHPNPRPVLEWAIRWLETHLPSPLPPVLCHRDFRTGNYLLDAAAVSKALPLDGGGLGGGDSADRTELADNSPPPRPSPIQGEGVSWALTGILDWEFAGWGDPDEDIGWFCCKGWRFARLDREAGGIAARAPFYAGYESAVGRRPDPDRVRFWEVLANVRWAVIALQQSDRHLKGGARDLSTAIIGRRATECDLELLMLLDPAGGPGHAGGTPAVPSGWRDLPGGAGLLALGREALLGDVLPLLPADRHRDVRLIATAMAIAEREALAGDAPARDIRDLLRHLYHGCVAGSVAGEGLHRLLRRLAADLRVGAFETCEARAAAACAVLWQLTLLKLREGNPQFLAANGFGA